MHCAHLPGGIIVCSSWRIRRGALCKCGLVAAFMCDWPIGRRKTCNKPLCERCRVEAGPQRDYCEDHVQLELAL